MTTGIFFIPKTSVKLLKKHILRYILFCSLLYVILVASDQHSWEILYSLSVFNNFFERFDSCTFWRNIPYLIDFFSSILLINHCTTKLTHLIVEIYYIYYFMWVLETERSYSMVSTSKFIVPCVFNWVFSQNELNHSNHGNCGSLKQ